ncbi:MAG: oligosaccharide flippase family protein, partial [Nitrospiraceae bacterium]|nr:oligosaccharide flippase family protein [Nitrospiraceae bacterium]
MISRLKQLKDHQGFRKYLANTSWLFFERILRMAVALFVGVYVARYLGPSRYGLLSYAMAFVGLFSAFASLGLDGIVVRELVKTPQKRDELLGTVFVLKLIGAVLMFGAIFIGVQFTHNDSFTNLLIAIIAASFIFQAFRVIDFNFQATVQSKYVVQAQVAQMVISSITKLILIWIEAPLLWFAMVSLSDAIVLAAGLIWNYLRKVGRISLWRFRIVTSISLLKDSWP